MALVGNPTGLSFFIAGTAASGNVQATLPSIFGGYAGTGGTCGSPSANATCNSCTGTGLDPCNQNSVHDGLLLNITLVSSTTATFQNSPRVMWKFSDDQGLKDIHNTSISLASGTPFTAQIEWSALCNVASGTNQGCTDGFTKTLNIGIDNNNDGTLEEKVDFNITFAVVSAADQFSTYCPTAATSDKDGICDYTIAPGDEKVYINEYAAASNDLKTSNSSVKFNRIVLFYNEAVGDITGITNGSPNYVLDLRNNSPSEPSISDPRLTGLQNNIEYCFVLANMDQTGNISKFAPAALTGISVGSKKKVCATPSEVVGLLDDKSCFIATATFGSNMAEEVQTFRRFRNEVLAKTSWGRAFIAKYYKYGPEAAEWISHSPTLKSLSVAILWPLLLFVKLCLWMGTIPTSLMVLIVGGVLAKLWQRSRSLKGAM